MVPACGRCSVLRRSPILQLACAIVVSVTAHADTASPVWHWRHIELEARKFLLVARSGVTVEALPAERLASQLVDVAGHEALAAPPSGAWRIDARSSTPGADSHVTVWLARDNLQLLQRERLDSVHGGRYKLTRILADGSYDWQRRGSGAPRGSAPGDWPLKRERVHRAMRTGDCTDSLGLLLLAADLARTERVRTLARVCTDEGALDVTLVRQGDARQLIAHTRVHGGTRTRVDTETVCRRIGMAVENGEQNAEDFRLLGLTGRLQVCVDAETGAPLRLIGTEPRLGEFRIDATLIETDR